MSVKVRYTITFFLMCGVSLFSIRSHSEMGLGAVQDPVTWKFTTQVQKDWKEGIVLDPQTGNYIITYKNGYGNFLSIVFEPATKITPRLHSKFGLADQGKLVEYRYTLYNAQSSQQGIERFRVVVSDVVPDNHLDVGNWKGTAAPTLTDSSMFLSWSCMTNDAVCNLLPGQRLGGLTVRARDLPGIAVAEISGSARVTSTGLAEYDASSVLGQQITELTSAKNFVPRNVVAPRIPVGNPFNVATALTGIQQHLNTDLASMKLVDLTLASQLDRLLQAAVDAAKLNNTKAIRHNIKDARKLLKMHCPDVDKDGDDDNDDNGNNKSKSPLIDKLAARVLDFDLKYVEKQLK